jgi:glucose/arabinose dehydrogenase
VHVYDGFLYVHSGSAGNATNDSNPSTSTYDSTRALLRRFDLSKFAPGTPFTWSSGEIFSQGLRNMVGFTRNAAGRMYGVVNGLDDISYQGQNVHNDNPGEQLVGLGMGKKFGYPFCFTAQRIVTGGATVVPPGTQLVNVGYPVTGVDDGWCAANSSPPATFFQAHSAPLDITFFDHQPIGALPEKWRGGAFVSLHGSWDRTPATGYKIVWVPFDAQGNAAMPTSTAMDTMFPYEIVFGGGNASAPKDGPWNWSANGMGDGLRPVGVAVGPIDGALYVSSDSGGLIYRIGVQK